MNSKWRRLQKVGISSKWAIKSGKWAGSQSGSKNITIIESRWPWRIRLVRFGSSQVGGAPEGAAGDARGWIGQVFFNDPHVRGYGEGPVEITRSLLGSRLSRLKVGITIFLLVKVLVTNHHHQLRRSCCQFCGHCDQGNSSSGGPVFWEVASQRCQLMWPGAKNNKTGVIINDPLG